MRGVYRYPSRAGMTPKKGVCAYYAKASAEKAKKAIK